VPNTRKRFGGKECSIKFFFIKKFEMIIVNVLRKESILFTIRTREKAFILIFKKNYTGTFAPSIILDTSPSVSQPKSN